MQYHIHKLSLPGIRQANTNDGLLHQDVYYTLNAVPSGARLSMGEVSTRNSAVALAAANKQKAADKPALVSPDSRAVARTTPKKTGPSDAEIKKLMDKWTCTACHQTEKRQVGPAWVEIAKRNYTPEEIVKLVYSPVPANWPGYATPMAPMPHVPEEDVLKIAEWINALD